MSDPVTPWGAIGIIVAGATTIGTAIIVLPKAAKAIINTARMAIAVNDAMPVVMRLPEMMRETQDHLKRQDAALAEVALLAKNAAAVASKTKDSTDAALKQIVKLTDGALSGVTQDLRDKNEIIAATDRHAIEEGKRIVEGG